MSVITLEIINSDANINNAIRKTVSEKPTRFWAYNNGLTAIVRRFDYDSKIQSLNVDGLSIVNGAQTTGVLGNLGRAPSDTAKVQIRFIAAKDAELVREIIQANNSQNSIEAADFRSTDSVQTRLREEFREKYPEIKYLGGRRGGEENAIRRDNRVIDSNEVAKALNCISPKPNCGI